MCAEVAMEVLKAPDNSDNSVAIAGLEGIGQGIQNVTEHYALESCETYRRRGHMPGSHASWGYVVVLVLESLFSSHRHSLQ